MAQSSEAVMYEVQETDIIWIIHLESKGTNSKMKIQLQRDTQHDGNLCDQEVPLSKSYTQVPLI